MTERLLRIRMRAIGSETVTRAVRGITQSARQAARAQEQSSRATARAQERSARQGAQAQIRADRDATREAQTSARTRERAVAREAAARTRSAQQAARAAAQADQRLARDEQRNANDVYRTRMRLRAQEQRAQARAQRQSQAASRTRFQMAGAIGGALIGGARALYGRVEGYQAATGMQSRDELVGGYLERQRATIRLAHQAGMSSDTLNQRLDTTATRSGVGQGELLAGLQYAQTTLASPDFDALDVFSRHLDEIADASYATGAPVEDLIGALGQARNQFGITEDDFSEMIGTMTEMAANGSIEVGDLAANFTAEMAQFRQLRAGVSGVTAAREFMGTAEAIGRQTPGSPEQASTAFRGVMTALTSGRVRRGIESGLRRGGLRGDADVFDDRTGALSVSMPELIDRMRRGHLDTAAGFDAAGIRNVRAQAGFRALLGTSSEQYGQIIGSSSDAGNAYISETNQELRGSEAGRVDQARAQAEANFQQNGAETVRTMVDLATATTTLQTRFPQLTESMGALSDVIGGMGLGGLAGAVGMRVAAGGTVAGALGIGGAGAAGGTAAAGGLAGAAGVAGTIAMVGGLAAGFWNAMRGTASDDGTTSAGMSADSLRASSGGLSAASRDELIRQRQMLGGEAAGQLQARVREGIGAGQDMSPATIRALAQEIGRAVAEHAPTPAGAPLADAAAARRLPAERR